MTKLSRREFLKGSAASLATLAATSVLGGCSESNTECPTVETQACPEYETPVSIWGDSPKNISEFTFASTVDCDVVIVGAGTAGMPAAVSCAEKGLKTVVLEKMSAGFGMRNYIGAINSSLQKEKGVNYQEEEIVKEMLRYSSYRAKADIIRVWTKNSGEAIDWYTNLMAEGNMGVWLETDINTNTDFKEYSTCHMYYSLDGSDTTETAVMAQKMESVGCDVRYSTPMVQLIQENGKVSGVVAKDENGNYIRFNTTKGVILATGGYAANTEMMKELNEKDYNANVMIYCDPASTGDGIKAAYHAGGEMDIAHTAMYFERGCTLPGNVGGDYSAPGLWWMGSQPFLQVNQNGKRFANESLPYDYDLHQASAQGNHVLVQIFDSNWQEDITAFHTIGCSRIIPAAQIHQGYEGVQWSFEKVMAASFNPALENGQLVSADTIDELAKKIKLPAETLVETVNHYNDLCAKGVDTDYYKESFRMRPVQKAPFYAVTVGGQLLCTMDGMHIDTNFNVLDSKDQPIEGLYAIGNDSGSYFADCYPELFVGAAAGRSVTFGYLIGRMLANK